MKYMDDKFRQKEALIDKLQLKNISLKTQILKAESQIKHKEEMGDDLKFIDFHQLQIENKKHVKDIDERNRRLLALKMTTGKTVQTLNFLKRRLTEILKKGTTIEKEIKQQKDGLKKTEGDIGDTDLEVEDLYTEQRQLLVQQSQIEDMPGVRSYVAQKEGEAVLKNSVKNWKRKIEIAEIAAREAKKVIREYEMEQRMAAAQAEQM